MQFGFNISSFERIETPLVPAAHREMLAQAALADQLGFDSIWIAEQHFSFERQCPFAVSSWYRRGHADAAVSNWRVHHHELYPSGAYCGGCCGARCALWWSTHFMRWHGLST